MSEGWREFWTNPITGLACGVAFGLVLIGIIFLIRHIWEKVRNWSREGKQEAQ